MRPCKYRAPPWSWASVEGPVTYQSQRSWQTMMTDEERIALECNFGRFKLEEVRVERRNLQISSGSLRVSGDFLPVTVDTRSQPPRQGHENPVVDGCHNWYTLSGYCERYKCTRPSVL